MQKRNSFTSYFLFFLIFSGIIFLASKTGVLRPVNSFLLSIFSPFQAITYNIFLRTTSFNENPQLDALKKENAILVKKLVDQDKLIRDNKALRDQFQTENPRSSSLIPADVVGSLGFIPGFSVPETIILDRGESDGVKLGDAVIYQNNLIGKVVKVSTFISSVMLITNSSSSFTAKTLNTKTPGVVKGQGGGVVIFDNVLLSGNLQKQDIVLTKGSINESAEGYPPDLIVGKIYSISKTPSDLFQKAEIKPLVDFTRIDKVFILAKP